MNEPSLSQQYWYWEKSGEAAKAPLARWLASIVCTLLATRPSNPSSPCVITAPAVDYLS